MSRYSRPVLRLNVFQLVQRFTGGSLVNVVVAVTVVRKSESIRIDVVPPDVPPERSAIRLVIRTNPWTHYFISGHPLSVAARVWDDFARLYSNPTAPCPIVYVPCGIGIAVILTTLICVDRNDIPPVNRTLPTRGNLMTKRPPNLVQVVRHYERMFVLRSSTQLRYAERHALNARDDCRFHCTISGADITTQMS